MAARSEDRLRYFASRGYPAAEPLAEGMEGEVYGLDSGLVAKVWKRRWSSVVTVCLSIRRPLRA